MHPSRLGYYRKAMQSMIEAGHARSCLWPLLHTWMLAAAVLPATKRSGWESACNRFALDAAGLPSRLEELDHFLDEVEIVLEDLAVAHGLDAIYRDGRKVP